MSGGKFYVDLRAAQGSRDGLLVRVGVISLVMRISQSVFWEARKVRTRIKTYVDDPLTYVCSNQT